MRIAVPENLTAGQQTSIECQNAASVSIQVYGTFSGPLIIKSRVGNTAPLVNRTLSQVDGVIGLTSIIAPGAYYVNAVGADTIFIIADSTMTGTATVVISMSDAPTIATPTYYATGLTTSGAVNSMPIDVSNMRSLTIQVSAITGNTLTFQESVDGINYTQLLLYQKTSANGGAFSATNATGQFTGPINTKFFRVSASGGSSTYSLLMSSGANSLHTLQSLVNQAGAWTVQPGNTQNSMPWLQALAATSSSNAAIMLVSGSGKVKKLNHPSPCNVYSIFGFNNGADAYLHIVDSAIDTLDNTTPVIPPMKIYADENFEWSPSQQGAPIRFTAGVHAYISIDAETKIVPSTSNVFLSIAKA